MKVDKEIPWYAPAFDKSDIDAVRKTVAGGFVNEGPENRKFEEDLQLFFDVPFAVTMPSCTISLALALKAFGIGHGDFVLIPAFTFIGTASAVRLAGAEPILVDIDPVSFNMDPDDIKRRILPGTRAILAVHLNGRPAPLKELKTIAQAKSLHVIEDTAEGLGSKEGDKWLGTLSEAGCFSLAPTKIITSGQGGFVLTRNRGLRDNLVRLRDHGRLARNSDLHEVTGFNFKFTDLQAALGRSQFKKLPARIERAREIDAKYTSGLRSLQDITFPPRPANEGSLMWPDFMSSKRDYLVKALKADGIHLRPFWPPLNRQPAYASDEQYPGADEAARTGCWLPCSPAISDREIDLVIDAVRHHLRKAR